MSGLLSASGGWARRSGTGPFIRSAARADHSTDAQRKQRLRELQQEAKQHTDASKPAWLLSLSSLSSERQPDSGLFSAHDVNPSFPHRISTRSPHPPAPPYDYEAAAKLSRSPPASAAVEPPEPVTPRNRGDVIGRSLAKTMRHIGTQLRKELDETRRPAPPPEQPGLEHAARVDRRMTLLTAAGLGDGRDGGDSDLDSRPTPPPFHGGCRPRSHLGWRSQRGPPRRRRPNAAALHREASLLAKRRLQLTSLRQRMRARFEAALLRGEAHALHRLEMFLKDEHEADCQQQFGDRCQPIAAALLPREAGRGPHRALAARVVRMLRASADGAERPPPPPALSSEAARSALMGTPEPDSPPVAPQRRKPSSARVQGPASNMLVPAPPPPRPPTTGRLAASADLVPPRPAKLISPASEMICDRLIRKGKILRPRTAGCTLTTTWELTAEETFSEIDRFELKHIEQDAEDVVPGVSTPVQSPSVGPVR